MTTSVLRDVRPPAAVPGPGWWIVAILALIAGVAVHWLGAVAILLWAFVQWRWPFDRLTAALVLLTAASFVDYTQGHLTAELAGVSLCILFFLFCHVMYSGRSALQVPRTPMTVPMLFYLSLSFLNFGRGLVAGQSLRYAGLEILAAMALGSCLIIASIGDVRARLRFVLTWLWIVCIGHLALGIYWLRITHVRTGRLSFSPVPGVLAMILMPFGLRARGTRDRIFWILVIAPLLLHQFLSFTRGYWLSIILGTAFLTVVSSGYQAGAARRWGRALTFLGMLVLAGVLGAVIAAIALHIPDLAQEALVRFQSSTSARVEYESSSNIVRISEYSQAWPRIAESPLFGKGFGFFLVIRDPFRHDLIEQWFIHNNYLLTVLKQGLLGLFLLLTLLASAVVTGVRNWRRLSADPVAARWCLGTAAATIYVASYCLVHFPLAEVNTIFILAFAWGVTMRLAEPGWWTLRWRMVGRRARGPRGTS